MGEAQQSVSNEKGNYQFYSLLFPSTSYNIFQEPEPNTELIFLHGLHLDCEVFIVSPGLVGFGSTRVPAQCDINIVKALSFEDYCTALCFSDRFPVGMIKPLPFCFHFSFLYYASMHVPYMCIDHTFVTAWGLMVQVLLLGKRTRKSPVSMTVWTVPTSITAYSKSIAVSGAIRNIIFLLCKRTDGAYIIGTANHSIIHTQW